MREEEKRGKGSKKMRNESRRRGKGEKKDERRGAE